VPFDAPGAAPAGLAIWEPGEAGGPRGAVGGVARRGPTSPRSGRGCDARGRGMGTDQALNLARDPANHHFIVPEAAAWKTVARTAKGQLGQALNDAMLAIERANAHRQNNFDGILTGKIDFNKQDELPRDKLVNLINHIGSQTFDRAHVSDDLFGNAYEYLIRNFASKAGKSSGEFYTPAEVGFLMAEMLEPKPGMSVCDWASGSGGLLLQCIRYVKKHGGDRASSFCMGRSPTLPLTTSRASI
jgi:type I restriction enzyme M protein